MSFNNENTTSLPPEYHEKDEINLIDFFLVILKNKRIIFYITLLAILLSVLISLNLTPIYTATARILPPDVSGTGVSSLIGKTGSSFGGLAAGLLGGSSSSDIYVGIMKSRTVADSIIGKFELMDLYEVEYMVQVYKILADVTDINVSKDTGIISISVEDEDPQRAADMANTYIEKLDQINRTVNITEGQRKRVFLEKWLEKAKEDLIKADRDLKEFQEKYKIVAINEQARVAIEGAAEIQSQIIGAETELQVLKEFGTERKNEAIRLRSKLGELRKQLEKMEIGDSGNGKGMENFYIPFKDLPNLGMKLTKLMREQKIQEQVFELLTSQYEIARIEEAKDINTIQILDKAVPPDKKSKPKRSVIVIFSTFIAFFIAVLLSFFLEFIERIKTQDPERYKMFIERMKIRN